MPVFNINSTAVKYHQVALDLMNRANTGADQLIEMYRGGRNLMWGQPAPFTTADAQGVIDALGADAIPLFQLTDALGQFINTAMPGVLSGAELQAPIAYTVVDGRIVLDPEAVYNS